MADPFASFRLTGRTALVTGARREIGRAIALGLAGAGARLAVHHADTVEESSDAANVVREMQAMGGEAAAFGQDFTHDDAGRHLGAAVTAWAPIDILVLNASIELPEDLFDITREHFDRQIAVNLRTTMELLQTLVPPMAERGWGRVVTIGSVQQERPHPSMFVYAGTKAAQRNWTLSLARQFGGRGVTVNNLAPGAILTARNREQMAVEGEALVLQQHRGADDGNDAQCIDAFETFVHRGGDLATDVSPDSDQAAPLRYRHGGAAGSS
jgi:NAD(P)-dependent dehydrogenase (short-subunit alcohol dehydrogenase family)